MNNSALRPRPFALGVVFMLCLVALPVPQTAGEPPPSERLPRPLAPQGRLAPVDLSGLAAARAEIYGRAATMSPLNLFDEWSVVFERVEKTSSGYALSGHLALRPLSSVTIVVNGDDVAGIVNSDQGTWHVQSRSAGVVEIRKQEETFRCGTQPAVGESRRSRSGARKSAAAQDDEDEIDVLVVFTEAARRRDGGFAQIRANIDLAVAATNEAYRASGVIQRINLVGALQVDYRESETRGKGVGIANQNEDLKHLISESDGYMDEVHALRDSYAADIVYLIVNQQGGGGVGWLLSLEDPNPAASAFAVSNSLESNSLFPHELGHVMGLNHDRYADSIPCLNCLGSAAELDNKPYPYSYGYVNQKAFADGAFGGKRWRTIMAYNSQCGDADFECRRIMRFSNPDQRYPAGDGDPLGVPGDEPSDAFDGPADAVRSLNNTRSIVANFRPSSTRCAYELSRTEHAVAAGGGSFSIRVNTETRCTWSARVLDGFLSVDSSEPEPQRGNGDLLNLLDDFLSVDSSEPEPQRGNGDVVYHVEPNQGSARIGFITVAGETLAIYQSGTALTSVCDRTAAIRDAIVLAAKRSDCSAVTELDLFNISLLSISHLDRSGEGITALKAGDFDDLVNLVELDLYSNWISSLPASVFQDLINLEVLHLSGMNAPHLPTGIFANLSNLNKLDLSGINLTELSDSVFSGLTKLEWLRLYSNELRSLPDGVFSDLGSLRYLHLDDNQLSGLRKETFEGLTILVQLGLSHNPLTTLPEDLFSDMEIGQLFLNNTQLTEIPPRLFRNILGLRRLHLNDNRIATFPPRIFPGENIQELHIRNNMLQVLPDELFLGFTSEFCTRRNMNLDLRDNPGTPFPLDLELVRLDADPAADGPASIAVRVAKSTPLPLTVGLSGHGGRLSATEATVPAGSVLSESIAVAGDGPVIVRLSGHPELPATYKGITIELGEPLRLFDAAGKPQAWLTPDPAEVQFYADDPARKTFTVHTNLDSVLVRANPSGSDPAIEVSGGQQVPTRDLCTAEGNDRPTSGRRDGWNLHVKACQAGRTKILLIDYDTDAVLQQYEVNVEASTNASASTALNPSYPNPFNSETILSYTLPTASDIRLEVFTLNGQRVAVLYEGFQAAGYHTIAMDASALASGVYLYRLTTPEGRFVQKLTLLR